MKLKKASIIVIIYVFFVLAAILTIFFYKTQNHEHESLKVGFITTGNVDDAGWNTANYRCIKEACDNLGAELITVSGVDEYGGHCKFAVEEVVEKGAEVVFLNSPTLAEQMRDLLSKYPKITFYGANADFEAPNLSAYAIRMYQARYLSGIVAGYYTKTNKIGYVAAYKDSSVCRGINAFSLGVQSVNPNAEVIVAWTNGWENEQREKSLAQQLVDNENIDLLTYHQHIPYVIDIAEQADIASIGYYEPVENVSDKYLTCATCDWTSMYETMLRRYMNGQGKAMKFEWAGIESGFIKLTDFSPHVSKAAADKVEEAKQRLISGTYVFSGEIYDNNGVEQCAEGETISDNTLMYEMNWLMKGVREYVE